MTAVLPALLFILVPGTAVIFRFRLVRHLYFPERLLASIGISCAWWIISYWFLSVLPISKYILISATFGISTALLMFPLRPQMSGMLSRVHPSILRPWLIPLIYIVCISIPQFLYASRISVPAGQDMSMHAYIARAISESGSFVTTLEPVVPISRFGMYPFGFSVLVAHLTSLASVPIPESARIFTALSHFLADAALYLFLRTNFNPIVSGITSVLVAWIGWYPHQFASWGANPTVLSLAFFLLSLAFLKPSGSPPLAAVLFCASFLTNFMIPVAAGYMTLLTAPLWIRHTCSILGLYRRTHFLYAVLLSAAALGPFAYMYFRSGFSVTPVMDSFVRGFQTEELSFWSGRFDGTAIGSLWKFLSQTFSPQMLILYITSLTILTRIDRKMLRFHGAFVAALAVLLANTRYYWLPLSSVMYPIRISMLLLIPVSLSVSYVLSSVTADAGFLKIPRALWITAAVTLTAGLLYTSGIPASFANADRAFVLVTADDIRAIAWLDSHAGPNDVILNSYHDAGVWIPAISGNRITNYHMSPVDYEEVWSRQAVTPAYAYIGGIHPDRTVKKLIQENPMFTIKDAVLVHISGNARVYRIVY